MDFHWERLSIKYILRQLDEPPSINRTAFEIWMLVVSFLSGSTIVITGIKPGSIEDALPWWAGWVWSCSLVIFPIIIAVSLVLSPRLNGLLLEYWTLIPYGSILFLYSIVALWFNGVQSVVSAGMVGAAAVSCWTTAWFIRKRLLRLGLWYGVGRDGF